MENSHTNPTMQDPPSRKRDLGWVLVLRFLLIVIPLPILAAEVSLYLFPRFEPEIAFYLALFALLLLWNLLQDRR